MHWIAGRARNDNVFAMTKLWRPIHELFCPVSNCTQGPGGQHLAFHPHHAGHHHWGGGGYHHDCGGQRRHTACPGADEGPGLQHHAGDPRWCHGWRRAPGGADRAGTDRRRCSGHQPRGTRGSGGSAEFAHRRPGGGGQHQLEHLHLRHDQRLSGGARVAHRRRAWL